jgi:hypothetical protein
VTREKLGKALLVNWGLAPIKRSQLLRIVIDANHFMADLSETGGSDKTYVSRTYNGNLHSSESHFATLALDSAKHSI